MYKVILMIDCASEHDRRLLRGMTRYSKENGPWMFYRVSPDFRFEGNREEWVVQWAKQWGADAIIGRWDERKLGLLQELNIPVVLQNNRRRSEVYSNITGDYNHIGRMAAQYFRKKLLVNYAFFGIKDIIWSEERCKGFRDEVLSHNGKFFSFVEPVTGDDREKIMEWLKSLPKPVAMFCCDDAHALFVAETCTVLGIRIPEDIAVLGVDNDDLLCNISDPTISSIEMDVENGGYMTCRRLHQQIIQKQSAPFNIVIGSLGIKERASTNTYNISDPQVLKIVKHIDSAFSTEIQIADILRLVPMSRRSVEMRFKNATGMTIYQYLLSVRVEHMAYLLSTTDHLFADIAYEVGFRDSANISRTFRKFKGCTPMEYRKKYCIVR
jgi:LacI family transcriptional regulator